jgi:hypothetical protein
MREWAERLGDLFATLRRFPLAMLLALALAGLVNGEIAGWLDLEYALERKVYPGLVAGFFWTLAAALCAEARGWRSWLLVAPFARRSCRQRHQGHDAPIGCNS